MNTTKDECDGWHAPETSGYPFALKAVIIALKNGDYSIARWNGYGWVTVANQSSVRDFVTHWRELPEPPKPNDAFEAWWEGLRINKHYPPDMARFVGIPEQQDTVMKHHAKAIWEAAINSTE